MVFLWLPKAPCRLLSYSFATLCWGQEPCIILLWTPKVQALFPAPQQTLREEGFEQNQINLGSKSGLCIYSTFWPWASYQGTLYLFHKMGVHQPLNRTMVIHKVLHSTGNKILTHKNHCSARLLQSSKDIPIYLLPKKASFPILQE